MIGLPQAAIQHLRWKSNLRRFRNKKFSPRTIENGTLIGEKVTEVCLVGLATA